MNTASTLASLACLTLTVVTLGYWATCVIWPYAACRKCRGDGKKRSTLIRAFRLCRRCHGTGRRLRIGRRLHNHLRRLSRNAQ